MTVSIRVLAGDVGDTYPPRRESVKERANQHRDDGQMGAAVSRREGQYLLVRRGTRRANSPVCRRHVGAGVRHLAGLIP